MESLIPIRCMTCGKVLADKYAYYCREVNRLKLIKSPQDIMTVTYLTADFHDKTSEGIVMDDLGLTKICCRRHMLTQVSR